MWPKSPRIRINEMNSNQNNNNGANAKKMSPRAPYNKALITTQMKKRRNQAQEQRSQKKLQSLDNKENVQLLNIPKAILLTPSSSDNSLTTSVSGSGLPVYRVQPKVEKPKPAVPTMPPYLTMKRQQTSALLNFRARKSLSQMDFKEARRTGNYQLVAHVPSSRALVPSTQSNESQLTIKDENLAQMLLHDAAQLCNSHQGNVRFVVNGDQDVRIASLRVFNTIMLRSWRRRREEVRHLNEQVEDFKRNFVKNRNQLHVYNTLFAVEKRRNDTLNDQLKKCYIESAKTKLSYNELNVLLVSETEKNRQLLEENERKGQEIERLQKLTGMSKNTLFAADAKQRELEEELAQTKQALKQSKYVFDVLNRKVDTYKIVQKEKQVYIRKLEENVSALAKQLEVSNNQLAEQKAEAELHISELKKRNEELELDIKQTQDQLTNLQNCLAATIGARIKQCLAHGQAYQHATFRLMHLFAYCMLPGTPPPSVPIASIPFALKQIRGFFNGSNVPPAICPPDEPSQLDQKDNRSMRK